MTLVAQIRRHAEQNYEQAGWDFLVECWEDSVILETIGDAEDLETAISRCARTLKVLDEHRAEVRAMADW